MVFVREECSKHRKQQVQKPCGECVLGVFEDSKQARILGIECLRGGVGDEMNETMGARAFSAV